MLRFITIMVYLIYCLIGLAWILIFYLSVPFSPNLVLFSIIVCGMAFAAHFTMHIISFRKKGVSFKHPTDIPIDDLDNHVKQRRLQRKHLKDVNQLRQQIEQTQ